MKTKSLISILALSTLSVGCFDVDEPHTATGIQNPQAFIDENKASAKSSITENGGLFARNLIQILIDGQTLEDLENFFSDEEQEQHSDGPTDLTNFESDMDRGIDYFLANPSVLGNTIHYAPDSRFCSEWVAKNNPASCIEAMGRVRLIQVPSNSGSGIINLFFDTRHVGTLSYGPGSVSLDIQVPELVATLLEIEAIVQRVDGEQDPAGFPLSGSGLVQFVVEKENEDRVKVTLNILSDFSLEQIGEDKIDISLSAASNLAQFTLDRSNQSVALDLGLSAAFVRFNVKGDAPVEADRPIYRGFAQLAGLTGRIELNDQAKTVTAQGITLGNHTATVDLDGQRAIVVNASPFDLNSSINGPILRLSTQTGLNASATVTDVHDLIGGSGQFQANIQAATEVEIDERTEKARVLSGSVSISATGDFDGGIFVEDGSCFRGISDNEDHGPNAFPLLETACTDRS